MEAPQWHKQAKCRPGNPHGLTPRDFDTLNGRVPDAQARALCHGCPVILECAKDALAKGDTGVVRAGVTLVAIVSVNHIKLNAVIEERSRTQ